MIAQPTRGGGGPRPSPSPQTGGGARPTPAASSGASSSRGWTGGARWQTVNSNLNAIGENSQARRAGTQAMVNAIGGVRGVSTAQSASSVLSRSSWKSYSRPMKDIVLRSSSAGGQGITSVPQPSGVMSHGPVSGTSAGSASSPSAAPRPYMGRRFGTPNFGSFGANTPYQRGMVRPNNAVLTNQRAPLGFTPSPSPSPQPYTPYQRGMSRPVSDYRASTPSSSPTTPQPYTPYQRGMVRPIGDYRPNPSSSAPSIPKPYAPYQRGMSRPISDYHVGAQFGNFRSPGESSTQPGKVMPLY